MVNRRERAEFARIEKALIGSDPALAAALAPRAASTRELRALVPFRIGREALISGAFVGSIPLAVEAEFFPLAVVALALAFWSSRRWVGLMRIAYQADGDGDPRLSPVVASAALFATGVVVALLGVVMLPWR